MSHPANVYPEGGLIFGGNPAKDKLRAPPLCWVACCGLLWRPRMVLAKVEGASKLQYRYCLRLNHTNTPLASQDSAFHVCNNVAHIDHMPVEGLEAAKIAR